MYNMMDKFYICRVYASDTNGFGDVIFLCEMHYLQMKVAFRNTKFIIEKVGTPTEDFRHCERCNRRETT